ncbi:MAG TPA: helix-turn-helix transcriptional regulator [Pyrinomonadaceae bacterium]|jgi:transcriptional regulator with XRE-family HTH domain
MGSSIRVKPAYLAEKLLAIRNKLDLSQTEIAGKLSDKMVKLRRSDISRYEIGLREPSLIVLLRYARLGSVTMEMLVDDDIELSMFNKQLK